MGALSAGWLENPRRTGAQGLAGSLSNSQLAFINFATQNGQLTRNFRQQIDVRDLLVIPSEGSHVVHH